MFDENCTFLVAPVHATAEPCLDRRWGAERCIAEFRKQHRRKFGYPDPPAGSTFRIPALKTGGTERAYRFDGCGWTEMKARKLSRRGRPLRGGNGSAPMFAFA